MSLPSKVVLVGAGLAAHNAAQHLRKSGFDGEIELIGEEDVAPYDRPPLSKDQLWSEEPPEPRLLGRPGEYDTGGIVVRTGSRASGLDTERRVVTLADGEEVGYQALVIATGTRARTLLGTERLQGVHTLRSFADCLSLRTALQQRPRIVVVGAGLIGCEVAGHAASMGMEVTVVDPQSAPLAAALGDEVGGRLGRLHRDTGSRMIHGVAVESLVGKDQVEAVRLSDGSTILADLVLVAFGAAPNVEWLADSGLEIRRGVICNAHCRTAVPDVYAIGDVAEAFQPDRGRHMVVEHWNNAREQGAAAAAGILGNEPPKPQLHYFWTDQAGAKIQALGWLEGEAPVRTIEWDEPKPGAIHLYGTPEHTSGAVAFNAAGRLMKLRSVIEARQPWSDAEAIVRG